MRAGIRFFDQGGKNMQKIINITGMACAGCASKVKKALEAVPGVKSVNVELAEKRAVVDVEGVADQVLLDTVNAIGKYKAESIA